LNAGFLPEEEEEEKDRDPVFLRATDTLGEFA